MANLKIVQPAVPPYHLACFAGYGCAVYGCSGTPAKFKKSTNLIIEDDNYKLGLERVLVEKTLNVIARRAEQTLGRKLAVSQSRLNYELCLGDQKIPRLFRRRYLLAEYMLSRASNTVAEWQLSERRLKDIVVEEISWYLGEYKIKLICT